MDAKLMQNVIGFNPSKIERAHSNFSQSSPKFPYTSAAHSRHRNHRFARTHPRLRAPPDCTWGLCTEASCCAQSNRLALVRSPSRVINSTGTKLDALNASEACCSTLGWLRLFERAYSFYKRHHAGTILGAHHVCIAEYYHCIVECQLCAASF